MFFDMRRKSKSLSFIGEQKKKSKNLKHFIIAFSVFVILLGSVSVLMFMKNLNFDLSNVFSSAETTTELTTEATTEPEPQTGSAKVLVFCENSEHTLDYVMLISCDYEQMKMTVLDIPVSTSVSYNGFDGSLNAYFTQYGATTLKDAVVNSLKLEADRYIKYNDSQFRNFLTKFEDVTVNVESAIDYPSDGLILNAGEQALSADLYMKYLNYCDSYHKADAFSQFLKIVFSKQYAVKAESLFSYIANNSQTDLSIVDFKAHEDRLVAFSQSESEIVAANEREADNG